MPQIFNRGQSVGGIRRNRGTATIRRKLGHFVAAGGLNIRGPSRTLAESTFTINFEGNTQGHRT